MKKTIAILLSVLMVFSLTACGGGDKKTDEETKEEVKLITNGRLSALEPPEGWEEADPSADNQLKYENTSVENAYGDPAGLWIDIDSYEGPEEKVERAKEMNAEIGGCEVEEVTIGDDDFFYIIPVFGYYSLYGTKDGVTVLISFDRELDLENEDIQNIIKSIKVAPEEEE